MPISLFSGLPGHGKTLRCLYEVEKLRKATNREVYYWNIKDLALPWKPLEDARKWYEVPDGSIVVIDEAWEIFPKRGPSAAVPKHVELLATHRHRGIDIYLVAQHAANQLDHFVRGLIDGHQHTIRLFGAERSRVHKWSRLGDPTDYHSLKESVTEQWNYPKEVYGWYKSAEIHTVQKKIPWKPVVTIVGGIALVCLLGWYGMNTLFSSGERVDRVTAKAEQAMTPQGVIVRPTPAARGAAEFVPTIQGAPFTAPFYSEAVKISSAPQVAGCGSLTYGDGTIDCRCHSQQGTRIPMDTRTCLRYLKDGNFRFDIEGDYYPKYEPYVPPLAEPVPMDASTAPSGGGGAAEQPLLDSAA